MCLRLELHTVRKQLEGVVLEALQLGGIGRSISPGPKHVLNLVAETFQFLGLLGKRVSGI